MGRLLTILAFVIAALPASGAAYDAKWNVAPITAAVNLPDPKHGCAELFQAAGKRYHTDRFPKTSETIGKLYATAIRLEHDPILSQRTQIDSFDSISLRQLIAAYADVMGCFVSHPDGATTRNPAPSPFPTRTP